MNPEFQRQLWLQFSPQRLVLMPLVLGLCFLAMAVSSHQGLVQSLALCGAVLFGLLVFGLGTYAASDSVLDEMHDHTWDQQRMSALTPWTVAWGKLFGATAYAWYGGSWCLLVAIPCGLAWPSPVPVLTLVAIGILCGIFLHAIVIALNLQMVRAGQQIRRRSSLAVLIVLWLSMSTLASVNTDAVLWWGRVWEAYGFMLASAAVFAVCALVCVSRSMSEVMAQRQLPWGLPLGVLVLAVYVSGFAAAGHLQMLGWYGFLISLAFCYGTLLTEPQTRPMWQRIVLRVREKRWADVAMLVPRWVVILCLALPFAIFNDLGDNPAKMASDGDFWLRALPMVFLALRDALLAMAFHVAAKGRRPVFAFLVTMLCLYVLLPWLMTGTQQKFAMALALPWTEPNGFIGAALALLHVAIAGAFLRWRWRATAHA